MRYKDQDLLCPPLNLKMLALKKDNTDKEIESVFGDAPLEMPSF